jgi:dimethylamine/trimethylamine dehydrogenase
VQARAVDKDDIRNLRNGIGCRTSSQRAGFDIVYVYATHDSSIAHQFLQRRKNDRTTNMAAVPGNRVRLLRELIEDTKGGSGRQCAVAVGSPLMS